MKEIDAMYERIKNIKHEIEIKEKKRRTNTLYSWLFGVAPAIYLVLFCIVAALLTFSSTISGLVSFVCFILFNCVMLFSMMALVVLFVEMMMFIAKK